MFCAMEEEGPCHLKGEEGVSSSLPVSSILGCRSRESSKSSKPLLLGCKNPVPLIAAAVPPPATLVWKSCFYWNVESAAIVLSAWGATKPPQLKGLQH